MIFFLIASTSTILFC